MISVQEIESACETSRPLDFSRHEVEAPELVHAKMFYPYGFPTEVRTNAPEIFTHCQELWGKFEKRFDTDIIRVTVHVVEGQSDRVSAGADVPRDDAVDGHRSRW